MSGRTETAPAVATALSNRTRPSRSYMGPPLKPTRRLSITISDCCQKYWVLMPAEYGRSNPALVAFWPQMGNEYGYSAVLRLSLRSTVFLPTSLLVKTWALTNDRPA